MKLLLFLTLSLTTATQALATTLVCNVASMPLLFGHEAVHEFFVNIDPEVGLMKFGVFPEYQNKITSIGKPTIDNLNQLFDPLLPAILFDRQNDCSISRTVDGTVITFDFACKQATTNTSMDVVLQINTYDGSALYSAKSPSSQLALANIVELQDCH
ncbi:MAG: hypothetical protein H6623_03400 [Bdellovibrionaceae bacterium]|nr:hypothetical protein [Pseudobdellovibrionaceae bacterium]